MRAFFEPRVVAVVGANRERGRSAPRSSTTSWRPASPARSCRCTRAPRDRRLTACRAVADIPGPVDLAVIVVPAAQVLAAVDDCIAQGACGRSASSAPASASATPKGGRAKRRCSSGSGAAGCRLIGPNCMGLLNTDPAVRLNATFSPVYPPPGNVAMSTQSGALGLAILDYAKRLDIGISSFVSVGNKADVSGNDLIQYWADDPRTSVILLYLESFGNPKKFSEIARRVGADEADRRGQGRTLAARLRGRRARIPARWRTSDAVVDALFRQAGVIRTERLEELFDVAVAAGAPAAAPRRDAWRSSPTPAAPASWRPMPARRTGSSCRRSSEATRDRAAVVPASGGQRRQSGGHAGVGAAGALPARARGHPCATIRSTASSRSSFRRSSPSPTPWRARSPTQRARCRRQAGARRVHAGGGRARDAGADPLLRVSRAGGVGARPRRPATAMAPDAGRRAAASSPTSIAIRIRRIVDACSPVVAAGRRRTKASGFSTRPASAPRRRAWSPTRDEAVRRGR